VAKAQVSAEHSLVIVDDPTFDTTAGRIPLLVVDGANGRAGAELLAEDESVAAEIQRRLARGGLAVRAAPEPRDLAIVDSSPEGA
jgi:hypothetical protein